MRLTARLGVAVLALAAVAGAGASPEKGPEKARVSPDLVSSMALRLDGRITRLSPEDPVMPVGVTQGAYFPGVGAVFMGSVNLAPMAGITPFHQTISKQEMAHIHQKKTERMPLLRQMMQQALVDLASSMDPVPAEEQIAVAISLFYFTGEDTSGLPMQVVMRGQRKALLEAKAAAIKANEF